MIEIKHSDEIDPSRINVGASAMQLKSTTKYQSYCTCSALPAPAWLRRMAPHLIMQHIKGCARPARHGQLDRLLGVQVLREGSQHQMCQSDRGVTISVFISYWISFSHLLEAELPRPLVQLGHGDSVGPGHLIAILRSRGRHNGLWVPPQPQPLLPPSMRQPPVPPGGR